MSLDKDDDLTDAINAAHPVVSKRYDTYQRATELVSNRHSKAALVNLVNYLLIEAGRERPAEQTSSPDPKRNLNEQVRQIKAAIGRQNPATRANLTGRFSSSGSGEDR